MALFTHLLGALAAPPVGRNRRISNNEQPNWNDGHMDMTRLAPGQGFELPERKGPGVITADPDPEGQESGGRGRTYPQSLGSYEDWRQR